MKQIKSVVRRLLGRSKGSSHKHLDDPALSQADLEIFQAVSPFTMTSTLRIESLLDAVRYVVKRDLPGAFAECGVWRGGSVMAMIIELMRLGVTDRDIYLYDTFEGMTAPTEADTSPYEDSALTTWQRAHDSGGRPWSQLFDQNTFNEELVREVLSKTGYPQEHLHFVRGPVEETLPATMPAQIALLRLDTDWYESTLHELEHLYPLLTSAGVLIIDDYGHWEGCRKAVDEYFARPEVAPVLLQRIDYTGRAAVKA